MLLASAASTGMAGTFSADFNNGKVPAGASVVGTTVVEAAGGVGGSGTLKLTKALNSQGGAFLIEDLDSASAVYGFSASFQVRIGGGTALPADGMSFNWGIDLPDATISEEGAGAGLIVAFDTYDNGGGEAPSIDVKFAGTTLASTKLTVPQIITTNAYVPVTINLRPTGVFDMTFKGAVLYTNLPVPGFVSLSGARFGLGARTGGANANHFVDDLQITTSLIPQVGILSQPQNRTLLAGASTTLKVGVNNDAGVSYQWRKNKAPVAGATAATLTLANLTEADSGARYSVEVKGPNNSVVSEEAVLNVVAIDLSGAGAPKAILNFNDGLLPAGASVQGTAAVNAAGGVNGSGSLSLTSANNGENGIFILEDRDAGVPVTGFTVRYNMLMGGGTPVPADGFSFNFASDLADATIPEAENGGGTGLTIGFDTFDNGGGEAPSVDVRFGGLLLASTKVPIDLLLTGDQYVPVIVQVRNDGQLDVVYGGVILYHDFYLPGFTSMSGGRFAWAARTGGLNANHFVDDISVATTVTAGALRFSQVPVPTVALVGKTTTFKSGVNLASGVKFQWFRNGTPIVGATDANYTTLVLLLTDDQAKYKVTATGPGGVARTSDEVVLSVLNLQVPVAPTVALDFNDGKVPTTANAYGNAAVAANGGVDDTGVLKLTVAENSQNGAFVMKPLDAGAELSGFTAAFRMRVGGGSAVPADGWSFNFASDFPASTLGEAENGAGTGITVAFDIYDNGGGEAPSIDVRYAGVVVASTKVSLPFMDTGDGFVQVLAQLNPDGTFDLAYNDTVIYRHLLLPGFRAISNGKFAWAARTGGLNENQWVDDIKIKTVKSSGPLRITQDPQSQVLLSGQVATFTVGLSDATGANYQWSRNGTAIAGATGASYTTPALTPDDNGATYRVQAGSPTGKVTSQSAVLTVVTPFEVSNPKVNFNFNDGQVPAGTELVGTASVDTQDGVNGSGVLKLTLAENGQSGGFYIGDLDGGKAVSGFTAAFKVRIGGGTEVPADGMSFVWANDVPAGTSFGEDGSGSGLVVSFDIYDNGAGEAPAIDVRYGGAEAATTKLPISRIVTGDAFVPVLVRVESDGTFDLIYNGQVIYNNLPLPGFAPLAGGAFIFGARTGGLNANQWVDDFALSTVTVGLPPRITSIQAQAGAVRIDWAGGGTLQSAPAVNGPWSVVPNAVSPYTSGATEAGKFYRVINP